MSAKTLFLAWQDNEPGQWLEMTIPDKPTSSNQKYRLTIKGRQRLVGLGEGR